MTGPTVAIAFHLTAMEGERPDYVGSWNCDVATIDGRIDLNSLMRGFRSRPTELSESATVKIVAQIGLVELARFSAHSPEQFYIANASLQPVEMLRVRADRLARKVDALPALVSA